MSRRKPFLTALLATSMLAGLIAVASAEEPRHRRPRRQGRRAELADHAGEPGPVAQQPERRAEGRLQEASGRRGPRSIPTGRSSSSTSRQDIGGEHARLLEQARAGRAPDCVTVDSFQLALFVKNGVLQPLDEYLHQGGDRRPLPVHPRRASPGRRPHLRLVVGHRPARPLPQHGHRPKTRRRPGTSCRRPRSTRSKKGVGRRALQRRPLGGHHLRLAGATSGPRAASSSTTAASRSSARARTATRC